MTCDITCGLFFKCPQCLWYFYIISKHCFPKAFGDQSLESSKEHIMCRVGCSAFTRSLTRVYTESTLTEVCVCVSGDKADENVVCDGEEEKVLRCTWFHLI